MSIEATVRARNAVAAACHLVEPGQRVLVACSGGADSLALMAAAAWVGERAGWRYGAVVVDHGLQAGSAEVAAWAADVCRRLGAEASTVIRVRVQGAGGPEAAARAARYDALARHADDTGAEAVLLGHTLEDQAETVLLRLARGSGARSLSGMSSASGRWLRPFLRLRREEVRASAAEALAALGERAWQDPHNDDPRYARVRVRTALDAVHAALGDGVVRGLARSADLLRDDADALDDWAVRERRAIVLESADGLAADAGALQALPRAVRTRVIRAMCLAAGAPADALGLDQVAAVDRLVTDWSGQGPLSLPGRVTARRAYGRLQVSAAPSPGVDRAP